MRQSQPEGHAVNGADVSNGVALRQRDPQLHRHADEAWKILHRHGIAPTARNYELLLHFQQGAAPTLARQLSELLDRGPPSEAELDELHRRHLMPEFDLDALGDGTHAIEREANALVERMTGGCDGLTEYGQVLDLWGKRLGHTSTVQALVQAVAALASETAKASQRNRELERELTASTRRIAKLRTSLADVRRQASVDDLTGVANRRAFESRLRRLIVRSREASSASFSVVLLDVDHFKRFNDTYGHQTGDAVLRLIARLLADHVQAADMVARYGGEEFALLLSDADSGTAARLAQRIRDALRSRRLIKRETAEEIGHVTVSAGVAQHAPGEGMAGLVARADRALYEAKRSGRDQVAVDGGAEASLAGPSPSDPGNPPEGYSPVEG